jgi:hypothetical protein
MRARSPRRFIELGHLADLKGGDRVSFTGA